MNNNEESLLNEEADRGLPSITRQRSGLMNKIVPVLLGLFGVLALIAINGGFDSKEDSSNQNLSTPNDGVRSLIGTAPPLPPVPNPVIVQQPKPVITTNIPPPPPRPQTNSNGEKIMTAEERKRIAGLFVPEATGINTARSDQMTELERAQAQANLAVGSSGGNAERADGLESKLTSAQLSGTRASLIIDRNMFVTKGSFLDCALETAISSILAGMTTCRLTRNIYSTNGKVLLIERGSRIVGEYQSGIQKGRARIFVLWSRIETPEGVIVQLDSGGSGPLGRSGHKGYIDTHFWERFGSAILLSLIDDVGNFISNQASGDNINLGGVSDAAEDAATIALKNSIDIPPTLIKHQGDHINIIVARDLDFRGVYELKSTN